MQKTESKGNDCSKTRVWILACWFQPQRRFFQWPVGRSPRLTDGFGWVNEVDLERRYQLLQHSMDGRVSLGLERKVLSKLWDLPGCERRMNHPVWVVPTCTGSEYFCVEHENFMNSRDEESGFSPTDDFKSSRETALLQRMDACTSKERVGEELPEAWDELG